MYILPRWRENAVLHSLQHVVCVCVGCCVLTLCSVPVGQHGDILFFSSSNFKDSDGKE